MLGSLIFYNYITDRSGSIVDSYIKTSLQKNEIFEDTLNSIPSGVVLIEVQEKVITF
jgi:hypothetical protein